MGEKRRTIITEKRKKVKVEQPCTADAIGHNSDLLIEIFLLLPAKSIIRFKPVCKHWHSIISDDTFSNLHTCRHRKLQTSFLLRASPSEFFHFNPKIKKLTPFHINHTQPRIRQSCNGLLLLECGYPNKDYYVLNPTTGKSRNLFVMKENFLDLYLSFDPSKSHHYIVICLRMIPTSDYPIQEFTIEFYDSNTHIWKRDERVYQIPACGLRNNIIYRRNCIYWKTEKNKTVCFNIETLTFGGPPLDVFRMREEIGAVDMADVTESGGSVHYIGSKEVVNCLAVYEDWSLKGFVDFDCVMDRGGICLMGGVEDEEEWSLVFHVCGRIMVYGFKDERFEEVVDLRMEKFYREGRLQFGWNDCYQFIESLVPV